MWIYLTEWIALKQYKQKEFMEIFGTNHKTTGISQQSTREKSLLYLVQLYSNFDGDVIIKKTLNHAVHQPQ